MLHHYEVRAYRYSGNTLNRNLIAGTLSGPFDSVNKARRSLARHRGLESVWRTIDRMNGRPGQKIELRVVLVPHAVEGVPDDPTITIESWTFKVPQIPERIEFEMPEDPAHARKAIP